MIIMSSIPNEADEDLYLRGKIEALRAQRRSQLGPCGCIDTDCILEKMEFRRTERQLNAKINELRLCLAMKERELNMQDDEMKHKRRQHVKKTA